MDKIIVFETYYNPMEANIIKARLMDSGIQCFLSDENMITVNPLYNQALGGVKLHLFQKDAGHARELLKDQDFQIDEEPVAEADNAVACPKCGSTNVGYVQATKNRFSILTMFVSLLLLVYPFYAKKTHHCFNCENEF